MFKGKKAQGINDTIIFAGICTIFVFFGALLPFIQNDFSTPVTDANNLNITPSGNPAEDTNPVTATFSWFGIFFSVAKMFVWSFGQLPLWAEIIFEFLRIILYVIGFRMIRGVS